jgi:hypothetical protein
MRALFLTEMKEDERGGSSMMLPDTREQMAFGVLAHDNRAMDNPTTNSDENNDDDNRSINR